MIGNITSASVNLWKSVAGPTDFGSGGFINGDQGSEGPFGIFSLANGLYLPSDYLSGSALSGNATWSNSTFLSLGVTPGTYVWTWGSGNNADSFTLNIGPVTPSAPAATHWLGQTDNTWSGANWASDAAGNATTATPTSNSTVTFSATGAGNQSATVLTANTTIRSLNVNDSNPVGIAGGKTLTISEGLTVRGNLTISGNGTIVNATSPVIGIIEVTGSNSTALTISGGAAVSADHANIASDSLSVGTLNVDGPGSKLTLANNLTVDGGGNGTLNITNGGVVSNTDGHLAAQTFDLATVTVDGPGSTWTNNGTLFVGESGPATLTIKNGGVVTDNYAHVAQNAGSSGTVSVDGKGSEWTTHGILYIGDSGNATVNITNLGVVTSNGKTNMATQSGSTSTVTVDGAGSQFDAGSSLYMYMNGGSGVLNIQNGGLVIVGGGAGYVGLATSDTGSGTLNIGAFGGNSTAGTVQAAGVDGVDGTATVNFNQTDSITFAPIISGSASVRQLGKGTTILDKDNTYTGETKVAAGQLILNGNNIEVTGGRVRF